MLNFIKRSFFTGLVFALPICITIFVINLLLNYIGTPISHILFGWLDIRICNSFGMKFLLNTISIAVVVLLIIAIGMLSKFFLGKWAMRAIEKFIEHVPVVKNIYKTIKQIVETFGQNHKEVFSKTVLIEYPQKDSYAIAFLTSETEGEIQDRTGQTVVNVFVPTTPNPTSGFLLMIPKKKVTELDMSVADGMKLIISGGVVVPAYEKKKG